MIKTACTDNLRTGRFHFCDFRTRGTGNTVLDVIEFFLQGSLLWRNVFHYVFDFALKIIADARQHKEVDSCNLIVAVILQLCPLNVCVDADLIFAYAL